jgi:hypothetical protein
MRAWQSASAGQRDVDAIAEVVVELVETRRADAGKPRPERRRT